jgi:hypothetical protein
MHQSRSVSYTCLVTAMPTSAAAMSCACVRLLLTLHFINSHTPAQLP